MSDEYIVVMKLPANLLPEAMIDTDEVDPYAAKVEMDVDPGDETIWVRHVDGETKDKDLLREYKHWRSGQIMPVEASGHSVVDEFDQ